MNQTDTIIILGSSNSNGNTRVIINYIITKTEWSFIDLNTIEMSYFDYKHLNQDDGFVPAIEQILKYQNIIFATPVYWYTMSGIMKVFFDRISDLLKIRKDLGRQLRGKSMAVISCSDDDDLNEEFYMPFIRSADYLGMHYLGDFHGFDTENGISEVVNQRIETFIENIQKK